jgi:hypothetical protein
VTDPSIAVDPEAFRAAVAVRATELMRAAEHILQGGAHAVCFTRAVLNRVLASATDLEELLDAYGAARNRGWYSFRRLVATAKLFSAVSYGLEHLLLFLPGYGLLQEDGDFAEGTRGAFDRVCSILRGALEALSAEARRLGIHAPRGAHQPDSYADNLPRGRLAADLQSHKVASPEQTVASVATTFLNLAEDGAFIHLTQEEPREEHADWIPDPVNEARLRDLEERFHSLQSLYDTHISDTNVESLDADLPALRGHISVIYHLLQIATALTHYCERHILSFRLASQAAPTAVPSGGAGPAPVPEAVPPEPPAASIVNHVEVLDVLLGYALAFASRYILSTRGLCHEMLKRYAIQGHITVPVPRYRGFHVRPSTLVARIVVHYGSEVTMQLEQESYNAGFTLDLFRANEKINAVKRRLLGAEVQAAFAEEPGPADVEPEAAVRTVAQRLFSQRKLVLYDRNLTLEGFAYRAGESMPELVTRALTRMLTMGKVDVEMAIMASFHGDRRVLEDIKLLAECGYGEDDFGNNLPLPAKLQYLRK